jgi:hypothetical protein
MNILEKFISIFKQCIIILSGFEKLHLNEYATKLAEDFDFELIEFKYPNYDALNKSVKESKHSGIIIYGLTFPTENLEFKPKYHLSLSGNKTLVNDDNLFNIYTNNVKQNFVNKFKNVKSVDFNDELYDDVYNICIDFIMKKVYGENYEKAQKKYLEDSESEASEKQVHSVKDEEDDTNDLSESSGGSYRKSSKRVDRIKRKSKKGSKKSSKKVSKKGSKKVSKKVLMKGGGKKTSKPKKLKRVIGTRLLMNVIKI